MTKLGPKPKGLTRREIRQLLKSTPTPRPILASIQQPTPPTSASLESRSSGSVNLDIPKPVSRRLLPNSKKPGGRHKPILVLDAASPPRQRRSSVLAAAHKRRRSQEEDTAAIRDLLSAFQGRVQQTAADLKEKQAELAKFQVQPKPSISGGYLATPATTPSTPSPPTVNTQQPVKCTPLLMLQMPDATPVPTSSITEALSPVPSMAASSSASDDPFMSKPNPAATATSSYIRSRSSAALEGKPASRTNDAGSRIPRPASHAAQFLHSAESPVRVPDTPVPAGPTTPRLLVSGGDKLGASSLASNGPPRARVRVQTIITLNQEKVGEIAALNSTQNVMRSTGTLRSLSAGTRSGISTTVGPAASTKRACFPLPPRARVVSGPALSNASGGPVRRSATMLPVSSLNKPPPITASYYEKENMYDKRGLARSKSAFSYPAGPSKGASARPPPMFSLATSGYIRRPSMVVQRKHVVDTRAIQVTPTGSSACPPSRTPDTKSEDAGPVRKATTMTVIEVLNKPALFPQSPDLSSVPGALKSGDAMTTLNKMPDLEGGIGAAAVDLERQGCVTPGRGPSDPTSDPNNTLRLSGFRSRTPLDRCQRRDLSTRPFICVADRHTGNGQKYDMHTRFRVPMTVSRWRATLLLLLSASSSVRAFNFTWSNPTECGQLDVNWTGGTPPFSLFIAPQFQPQIVSNISDSAFSNGHGSFSMQLPLPQNQTLVMTMSDGTGFGTGGVTEVIEVGASTGTKCNTTNSPDFVYDTPLTLQQCRSFTFEGYRQTGAVMPVTINALIPGGTPFVLHPPADSTTFQWMPNVKAGTSIIFSMTDSLGRRGGASDILTVGDSATIYCLTGAFPSSTIQSSAASKTSDSSISSTSASQSSTTSSTPAMSGRKTAIIVAVSVVGAMSVIGGIVAFYWFRKRRQHSTPYIYSKGEVVDLDDPTSSTLLHHQMYEPDPFLSAPGTYEPLVVPSMPPAALAHAESLASGSTPASTSPAGPIPQKTQRSNTTGSQPLTYILHTDAAEVQPDE
ncbi:hypothetical protein EVG20_g10142, partial [Dentipellis fragilis]